MRISDWSSDVCSSDLIGERRVYNRTPVGEPAVLQLDSVGFLVEHVLRAGRNLDVLGHIIADLQIRDATATDLGRIKCGAGIQNCRRFAEERSEEHTSELQSLMRISYAVFCLKKKNKITG